MEKTKLLTIAIIGLLILNFGTLGIIFLRKPPPMHEGMPPRGEGPKKIIIERLHFDEAQQKEYEVLIEAHRSGTDRLHEASRKLHNELYSLLGAETIDKAKSDSLILQISANQQETDHLNFDHFEKIRALCKPEQLKDFYSLSSELARLFGPGEPPPRP